MTARSSHRPALHNDLPTALGIVAGLVLPVVAAALFSTYTITVTPTWLEVLRQTGVVWLAGEVVLIAIAYRCGFDMRSSWRRLPRWAQAALAIFLSTFWISSLTVSTYPAFSILLSVGWIIHILYAGALFHLCRSSSPHALAGAWCGFPVGLAVIAVFTAIHFIWLPAELHGDRHQIDWALAIPGFISVRLFGAWTGAIFALMIGVAWSSDDAMPRRQHAIYAATALAFALMIWTTTRAAMLASVCIVPVACLWGGRPASRNFLVILPIYLIIGVILALPLQPHSDPAFTFFETANLGSADQITSGRLTIWTLALKAAAPHPWLGTGAGSSFWLVTIGGTYPHHVQPHNAVVQFILNWGLIPTLAAIVLLGGATWHAHKYTRANKLMLPFLLMLDSLLFMSMFDGMLHFSQFVMLIFGCISICLSQDNFSIDICQASV